MRIYVRVRILLKTSVCICMFITNTHPQRFCIEEIVNFAKKNSLFVLHFYFFYVLVGESIKKMIR